MNRNEIMDAIEMLARSQGMYGRMLSNLKALPEDEFDEVMNILEDKNFSDVVDMVMYFEC